MAYHYRGRIICGKDDGNDNDDYDDHDDEDDNKTLMIMMVCLQGENKACGKAGGQAQSQDEDPDHRRSTGLLLQALRQNIHSQERA